MSQGNEDTFDRDFSAALRARPEHSPGVDLAAEARRRGAAGVVPAGLLRWGHFMRWCSALGALLIVGIILGGWCDAKTASAQGGGESQVSWVVVAENSSGEGSSLGWMGLAALGVVMTGLAVGATLATPAPRFDAAA